MSNISVAIYLSAHKFSNDAKSLSTYFDKCDIYFMETLGWPEEYQILLNDLAVGKVPNNTTLGEFLIAKQETDTFLGEQLKMIYKSKKIIRFCDIPNEHPAFKKFQEISPWKALRKLHERVGSTEEALDVVLGTYESYALLEAQREDYIVRCISEETVKLQSTDRFANQDEINVLASLGKGHSQIVPNLKKTMNTATIATYVTFEDEFNSNKLLRSIKNKEKASQKLLINVLAETFFFDLGVTNQVNDSQLMVWMCNTFTNSFSDQEFKDFYALWIGAVKGNSAASDEASSIVKAKLEHMKEKLKTQATT